MISQLTDTIPWIHGLLHSNASVLHSPVDKICR